MWRRRQSRLSPQRPSSFVLRPASCVHLRWHILHLSCSLVSPSMLANPLPASLMSWCCSALLDIVSWCLLLGNCQLLLPLAACVELPVPLHLAIDSRPSLLTHVNIMAAVHHLIPQCVNAWICDCGCPLNPSALGPHSELLPDIPNIHPYILVFLSSVARLFARGN